MSPSRLRRVWAEGRTAFGAWCVLPSIHGAELLAAAGFDYVCVDCQHGVVGYEDMTAMVLAVAAAGCAPLVRVPAADAAWIGRALDAGAEGVIVPLVSSPEEAGQAAAACRFPPQGTRSFGLMRAVQPLGTDPAQINREVICLPMIETSAGLAAAEAICSVPGVDGVYVGPADLAVSLGVDPGSEAHQAAVDRIRSACGAAGIVAGIHARGGEQARARAAEGFRMVTAATDAALLAAGARRELGAARGG